MKNAFLAPLPAPYPYRDFQEALKRLKAAMTRGPAYALLLGESGTGKTTLLRTLSTALDRQRFQVLYLCHGQPSPTGLTRVLADALHLPLRRSRAETSRLLIQTLRDLPSRLLFWIDEVQLIREETLHEIRLLAEANLNGPPLFSVVLSALPDLKDRLLAPQLFPLWRRISLRVTLTGLVREEVAPFLAHLLGKEPASRFAAEALAMIFERARGVPAQVHSLATECLKAKPQGPISPEAVGEALDGIDVT
jgi:type II secretory pathway predicted ATPase ExeA